MSELKSQKNANIPADLQPYYDDPRPANRSWLRWLVRLVVLIIIVCLIAVFVRWVWHQTHTEKAKPATSTAQKSGTSSPITLGGNAEGNDTSSDQTASGTSSDVATSGNSAAAATVVGQSSELANTGPGQTIGIFVASSACFALLYQLRLRQQKLR